MQQEVKELEARLRQVRATVRNGLEMYMDLADTCPDPEMSETFREIARTEARHVADEKQALLLVEQIKREIADGTYETAERFERTIEGLVGEIWPEEALSDQLRIAETEES
jgi:rubrerythrin